MYFLYFSCIFCAHRQSLLQPERPVRLLGSEEDRRLLAVLSSFDFYFILRGDTRANSLWPVAAFSLILYASRVHYGLLSAKAIDMAHTMRSLLLVSFYFIFSFFRSLRIPLRFQALRWRVMDRRPLSLVEISGKVTLGGDAAGPTTTLSQDDKDLHQGGE